ncbi:hypothetical protein DFA_03348 [Cavenderia fasciculata]|uniref:Uncharacterized protein n=1 Tax=Cavenderia fasciculata TaxID=261658 RepID=F4PHB8_CACFS|nr:uncharacterized protein DFA_03348 [Cavenderia fasciculata]EGG25102.1 hypothetical protein DFA_03348 [Cavenderia fasciculata]|eukprot:XP_004362953.1 hypothetical protein DFA_03348 [Cavenderia fasciculata]
MGSWFMSTPLPTTNEDESLVGDVYLVTYTQTLETSKTLAVSNPILRDHYTIVIDVAGQSTEEVPKGYELHLEIQHGTSKSVNLVGNELHYRRTKYAKHQKLGRITNEYHSGNPREWADGLKRVAQNQWYKEFIQSRGDQWNHECNSHQFAKFLTLKLGLEWPNNLYVAGEGDLLEPLFFNILEEW